jgi:hypothetical protein
VALSLTEGKSTKPPEVLIFVLITAMISMGLGLGILRYNVGCYRTLIFFSLIVILSKILIFANIITLNGALETTVPSSLKNIISLIYHSLLMFYFTRRSVKQHFIKVL